MTRPTALLSIPFAFILSAPRAQAQTENAPSRITAQEIDAHLRFLASDLLEGRAPATRGGRIAEEYIATQLQAFGVKPGVGDSSYFQRVPIDVVKADPATIHVVASGKANANLRFTDDVVVWPGSATDASSARGELVFVGYGAVAPEYKWDDFKNTDVRGKVLLVLVNDPPAPASEPNLFGGKAMTYYGRWTYKYEEAERRGAAGVLIVHTTGPAGYPWHVVVNSNSTEHRLLLRDPAAPAPIGVRGWITDSAATALLAQAGLNMTQLRRQAESRDFRPVSTGITIDASMKNSLQHMSANNVVGVVRGIDPKVRDEYVAYIAHWDHLGIGPAVNGDSIYNGAKDNAVGTAGLLEIARAFSRLKTPPKRSVLFLAVTAEEQGLLGSQYYTVSPLYPLAKTAAAINMDAINVNGRTRDLTLVGYGASDLDDYARDAAGEQGRIIRPDPEPDKGYYYRSDHFNFAKAGVPAMYADEGTEFIGKPEGYGERVRNDYTNRDYHAPSDEVTADWDLSGSREDLKLFFAVGFRVAEAAKLPEWKPGNEFRAIREKMLAKIPKPGA